MLRRFYILCAALLAVGNVLAQQVEPRIAGLEGNAEYMSLLRDDAQLLIREDSVVNAVEGVRQLLRENPDQRQRYSQDILRLEGAIFEIRNAKGRLVDRINAIEQDWVFANLNSPRPQAPEPVVEADPVVVADSLKVRNLVDNLYFREHLPSEDYAALRSAQGMERQAVDYVNRYRANHAAILQLVGDYAAATAEAEALDMYGRFTTLQGLNDVLADSLAQTWNYIFDNKSYAYGYLLDKLDKDEILSREEEQLAEAARQLSTLRGQTASDAVVDYFLRKRVIADYEVVVSSLLGLDAAQDSLKGVVTQLRSVDLQLPKAQIQERLFLDYDSLRFSNTPAYNSQRPIPECRVFARGTIYRILLGTFTSKRPVSTFRGTEPLCYQIGEDGRWSYYAGGFGTKEEAVVAQKQLKTRGFLRPEIVVWTDGVYHNLTRDPAAAPTASYRIEIIGVEALSDPVKAAIAQGAEGRELSRVGQQMFVVGLFDDEAAADRVAEAIRQADGSLEIKVAEMAE